MVRKKPSRKHSSCEYGPVGGRAKWYDMKQNKRQGPNPDMLKKTQFCPISVGNPAEIFCLLYLVELYKIAGFVGQKQWNSSNFTTLSLIINFFNAVWEMNEKGGEGQDYPSLYLHISHSDV